MIDQCSAEWTNTAEQDLCIRIALAGFSVADTLSAGTTISFDTPSMSAVDSTIDSHPEVQCRLDTYFAGALCAIEPNLDVVAGVNNAQGRNSISAELDSAFYTCSVTSELVGASNYNGWDRPSCWFKSQISEPSAAP